MSQTISSDQKWMIGINDTSEKGKMHAFKKYIPWLQLVGSYS